MARIRTIKPDFFTSEDIVSLSPLARLLYIATWCEADKEGRLAWKPNTFKLRYLPGDNCDALALAQELVDAGLVVLYGDGLAYIPKFKAHQHINPRESESTLPDPDAKPTKKPRASTQEARVDNTSSTRADASPRVPDAQGGREGKGKEGNEYLLPSVEGCAAAQSAAAPPAPFDGTNAEALNGKSIVPLASSWALPESWGVTAEALGFKVEEVLREEVRFRSYWTEGKGKGTRRSVKGWNTTWMNWLDKAARDAR